MRKIASAGLAGLALSALFGILVGAGAFVFSFAEGTSYLSNDPKACVNCHIMREQYDGWQKASHHAVATCNDCHVPHDLIGKYAAKVDHGYRHSKAFTFQDFHEPIRITARDREIVQANCVRCHQELVSPITEHGIDTDEIRCSKCHAGVGHGPTN